VLKVNNLSFTKDFRWTFWGRKERLYFVQGQLTVPLLQRKIIPKGKIILQSIRWMG
jgi:hypothetical protein